MHAFDVVFLGGAGVRAKAGKNRLSCRDSLYSQSLTLMLFSDGFEVDSLVSV